jgi:hypothetical protein
MYRLGLVLLYCAVVVYAQIPDQIRRATIRGSKGTTGQCTIEVRVDHSAEVDVYGDSGRLRTLAGQAANWTRMECTDGLPTSMTDFRFRGIDGRGSVKLAQDPRNNNGIAVIRIDDPRGGSEGYTFSIEWSGASGSVPQDGFQTSSYPSTQTTTGSSVSSGRRSPQYGRGRSTGVSTEAAIDSCRAEVRTRGQRDYNLQNIDITSAGMDTSSGRRNTIGGTFNDRSGSFRRGSGYKFNCVVDFNSGQVQSVEILRADGTAIQPLASAQSGYDQNQVLRACQDAVVARAARDGYQNVSFSSTAVDTGRANWVSGTITASRGPVTDTFDFGCSMNLVSAQVQNVQLTRR